jgi:hypothetical protein
MTMVVRDEEDVVGANLDYHLAQGVDAILVTDHASSDGTPEILAEHVRGGRVHVDREEGESHDQVSRVNRLLRAAVEAHGADWVIHCDADEFWMPAFGSLRDVFPAVPERFGYLKVERVNFVPVPDDGRPFEERMTVRERRSQNLRGEPLEPKVAQRPAAAHGVVPGNHDLEDPAMEAVPGAPAVTVGHFPIRSYEQFEKKVINTGVGYERLEHRGAGVGEDQLELLRKHRAGELREHYDEQVVDGARLERGLASGQLVIDERVRTALAGGRDATVDPERLHDIYESTWLAAGTLIDERSEQEQRARRGEARAAELFDEVNALAGMLAEVKASRIMRYTAAARRIYYRLRPSRRPAS